MAKKASGGTETPSKMGYFRAIFKENPKLLNKRSNDVILQRWRVDHPGYSEVPKDVKDTLANVKSVLRHKKRKRRRKKAEAVDGVAAPSPRKPKVSALETLEIHIDDGMTLAKIIDRAGLDHVIKLLRKARNEIVWMSGQ